MNWMNPVSLVMSWMNLVSLVGRIVYLCRLYSEDNQETYSIRDFVHKTESIIVHMLEI